METKDKHIVVDNVIIPTKKIFRLVKELKEERKEIPIDVEDPKKRLVRYKLKVQYELLNNIIQHLGVDKLLERQLKKTQVKEMVKEIPAESKIIPHTKVWGF